MLRRTDNLCLRSRVNYCCVGVGLGGRCREVPVLAVEYSGTNSQSHDCVTHERRWMGPFIRWVALAACAAFWVEIIRLMEYRL
jgi:hypothetical protein